MWVLMWITTEKLCGDVDTDGISSLASVATPVPGGVGSVTTSGACKAFVTGSKRKQIKITKSERLWHEVAICDDSEQDIADLKEKLLKIIEGQIENCEIHVYTDVTKFLKEIHTISFDGIFLDIDMPQMTGIQAAQRVREALPDVGLVFVSSCESMVFEAIKHTASVYQKSAA